MSASLLRAADRAQMLLRSAAARVQRAVENYVDHPHDADMHVAARNAIEDMQTVLDLMRHLSDAQKGEFNLAVQADNLTNDDRVEVAPGIVAE